MRRVGVYVKPRPGGEWNIHDNPLDNLTELAAKIVEDMTPEEREVVKRYIKRTRHMIGISHEEYNPIPGKKLS